MERHREQQEHAAQVLNGKERGNDQLSKPVRSDPKLQIHLSCRNMVFQIFGVPDIFWPLAPSHSLMVGLYMSLHLHTEKVKTKYSKYLSFPRQGRH